MTFISKLKSVIKSLIIIFISAFVAMIIHAILPSKVDASQFDSLLVRNFGFIVTAILYFIILYTHCNFVVHRYGLSSGYSKKQIALRYGFSFAAIYLLGMEELVPSGLPFQGWDWNYVSYQFFMGLGDAIPVMILCILITYTAIKGKNAATMTVRLKVSRRIIILGVFTLLFLIERTLGYRTGVIVNNGDIYPLQTYIWTALFGAVIGMIYIVLYPMYENQSSIIKTLRFSVCTIGINWMIFNGFIGMLLSGYMPKMILRTSLDMITWVIAALLAEKIRETKR